MNNNEKVDFRYFIFSSSQMKDKIEIEKKIGRKYQPGTVLTKGSYKQFTDIIKEPTHKRYSDAIIVAYGDINTMKYRK